MNDLINMSFIYYNRALECIDKNNISGAKENLEKATEIYLKDTDILNLLGICEYYFCDFNMANYYWNKSIRINNERNIAIDYIDKLKTDEFKSFMNRYNEGLDYLNGEKYEDAIEIFNGLLKYENKFIEIYEIMIVAYLESGDTINAQRYIELLSKIDTGNKSIEIYKCKLLEIKNKFKPIEKEVKIRKSSEKNHKIGNTSVFLIMALLLGLNVVTYTNLQKIKNENLNIKQKLEKSRIEYAELEKENNKFIEENSQNKYKNVILEEQKNAEKYYFNEEYKKSIKEFKKILKNTSDNATKADAIYFIAASETKLGNINEAKKYYKIYVNSYENGTAYDEVLYNYALILNNDNELEKAKEIAMKLRNNYKNSEYNNSKIDSILNK